jgi:hypothetical protein
VVEQFAVNELVVGSSPTSGAKVNVPPTAGLLLCFRSERLEPKVR